MKYTSISIALLLFALGSLYSCTPLGPYKTEVNKQRTAPALPAENAQHRLDYFKPSQPDVAIAYVEFNEYGNLFDRTQMYDVVNQIKALENPIVLVFTHGWHHDAHDGDENVESFKKALLEVKAFENLTGPSVKKRPVVGVYVGWRGESITYDKAAPLSLLTFFDRKNTAHDVGNGGVEELFVRLSSNRYRAGNEHSRLVLIGHSFGGLITYTALHHHFIERVTTNNSADYSKPIADAVVLINPAIEAMRFKSLFEIAWSNDQYQKTARPMLAIITTQADSATRVAFNLGRKASTIFNHYASDDDKLLNTTAIGHYKPFVTHTLLTIKEKKDVKACNAPTRLFTQTAPDQDKSICFENGGNAVKADAGEAPPLTTVLTRCDTAEDCKEMDAAYLIPKGETSKGLVPFHVPILNIHTSDAVMGGHSLIWGSTMRLFLIKFIVASLGDRLPADM